MFSSLSEKVKNLEGVFTEYKGIACAYLFGSQLKGYTTPNSDIDFAVLIKEGELEERALLAYKIEKALGFIAPVQIIVLNQQRLVFRYNVMKDGKIVYEADRDYRVKFEVELMRQYSELEPHLRFMEKYYAKGLLKRLSDIQGKIDFLQDNFEKL